MTSHDFQEAASGKDGCGGGKDGATGATANARNPADAEARTGGEQVELGFDLATHGGGSVEDVPGFSLTKPMVEGVGTMELSPLPGDYQSMKDAAVAHFEGGTPRESVCGADDRVQIERASAPPWRMIAKLFITSGDGGRYVGTGWFISPRTVVTAGHCVFSSRTGGWARSIEVVPGMNGRLRPFGTAISSEFKSVNGWIEREDIAFDIGCIVLPRASRLGDKVGWFGFANLEEASLRNLLVNTSGYPADKTIGTQWFNAGRITEVQANRLAYFVDTFGGQSGSPVWRYRADKGSREVVGIHNYGGCANRASRIGAGVFERLKAWKALGA